MKDESRLIFVPRNSSTVKEYKISRVKLFTYISIFLIGFTFLGKISLDLLVDFSHNSKIKTLERTNIALENRLKETKAKINALNTRIADIIKKDDELRTVLGLPRVSSDVRNVGIGGADYNYDFIDEISGFDDPADLNSQLSLLSKLERESKLELESYNALMATFERKQDSIRYLPSLKPVLTGVISSGFGLRRHPIYKVRKHHDGLDFSAAKGTPVYASADGTVSFTGRVNGYGKLIKLNHKYGFVTRYGHLSKIVVRRGQQIKRGQKIGEVGSTGLSTAPHLHYEVRYYGKAVNPSAYYFDDHVLNEKIVNNR
ncbi:MAG TPA: M23 family metallopeptidase [Caldithrix abyssi]|uniref:M23 family metallopeptidase n=1 Tax=Caldithrix abyssi TaxID=187145 RepID=A0A7V1LKK5_CALAY|nr:M23 family metallopeptidase [Caldithrix abyssi]